MIKHADLLQTPEAIHEMVRVLREQKCEVLAFDTEFIRETTFFPAVEILQVASETDSWLVDARAFRKRVEDLRPLLDLFTDKSILKIVHAAHGDQECLFTSFGVIASPSLDTAVAASLCGHGDSVGLGTLLKSVLGITIKKGHARTNWSVRPLPPQLVEYAHADVEHLVQLAKKLMEELDRRGRKSWALELSAKWEDPQLYDPDPDSLTERLSKNGKLDARAFSALKELMRWREGRCREINVPRRWVADDSTLLDLAQVRPKDIEHLSAFRGLNKGELKHSGAQILEALKRAAESPQVPPPRGPRPDIPTPDELQALELLKCFIGILADQKQIALKHLVTSPQLLALLRCMDAVSVEDLASRGVLSQGAAQLIGVEVLAFLRGERALSLEILQKGCRVRIVS